MSEFKYVVYEIDSGYVQNLIVLNPTSDWQPPAGCSIEKIEDNTAVAIGWTRESELVYIEPVEPVIPPSIDE